MLFGGSTASLLLVPFIGVGSSFYNCHPAKCPARLSVGTDIERIIWLAFVEIFNNKEPVLPFCSLSFIFSIFLPVLLVAPYFPSD